MIGLVLVDPAHTPFICYLLVCQIASSQLEAQGTHTGAEDGIYRRFVSSACVTTVATGEAVPRSTKLHD